MSVEIGSRRVEAPSVVRRVHRVYADAAVRRRRMNESIIADVYADVGERGVARVEKDEITGAQFPTLDRSSGAGNVGRTAVQFQAGGLAEYVGNHSATIEAGVRILAPEAVACVDQSERIECDFVPHAGKSGGAR